MSTYNAKRLTIVKGSDTYIIDPMQGNESAYIDQNVTIAVNAWTGNNPYTYVYSDIHITSNSVIAVYFQDGIRNGLVGDLKFTKSTGYVTFETDELPIGPVPLKLRIIDGAVDGVYPVDANLVETDAVVGETTVQGALEDLNERVGELDERTEGGLVKTVNAIHPDENGEVRITKVAYSDNFTSDKTQNSEGEFIIRTSGGDASIADGDAFVMRVYGNSVHEGYVPESLSLNVTMAERIAQDPITAELDKDTFIAYVSDVGMYTLTYTSGTWDETPGDYGVTVTGTPLDGDSITITWDGEDDPMMTVFASRVAPGPIAAYIDRDTFVAYISVSGTTTLSYTTAWSANPALYGVTVTGTPTNGDSITITYVKEERGAIYVATPTAFKSTGWNLYNNTAGYAYLCKYSTQYGFLIGGAYSALQYSQTIDGAKSTITPVDGVFTIPADGYVWVTGGNNTTTFIINQWSDWTDGPAGDFEPYSETTINLSTVMSTYFPYGLCRVGVARDEINLNASVAISKVDRMTYNAENLAAAKESGRPYEYDTNYIYILKSTYESNAITLDGEYTASDHGNEFFVGNDVPTYLETMYGNNLKNKLERDVVTISQQALTNAQKQQVRSNLSAASQSDISELNGNITKISMSNFIGTISSKSELDTALDSILSEINSLDIYSFSFTCGANFDVFFNYVFYFATLYKSNDAGNLKCSYVVFRPNGVDDYIHGYRHKTEGWSYISIKAKTETNQITSGYTLANAVNNQWSYISIIKKGDIIIANFSIYLSDAMARYTDLIVFDDIEAKYVAAGVLASSDEDDKCIPIRIMGDGKNIHTQRALPANKRYNGQLVFVCK